MKMTLMPNTGSLSRWYNVEGTVHIVMEDWSTGWYKVLVRKEIESVKLKGHVYRQFEKIMYSDWLKSYSELENFFKLLGRVDGPITYTECFETKRTVRELLKDCINWHQDFIAIWRHYSYLRRVEIEEKKSRPPKRTSLQKYNRGEVKLE